MRFSRTSKGLFGAAVLLLLVVVVPNVALAYKGHVKSDSATLSSAGDTHTFDFGEAVTEIMIDVSTSGSSATVLYGTSDTDAVEADFPVESSDPPLILRDRWVQFLDVRAANANASEALVRVRGLK